MQDIKALLITTVVGGLTVKGTERLGVNGYVSNNTSRKIMHIATGLVYALTWPLYSYNTTAPLFAAIFPFLATMYFVLVGLGLVTDKQLVSGTTRRGRREELLRGPTFYGFTLSALAAVGLRQPYAIIGLSVMCAGDGAADIFGRMFGQYLPHWPHNPPKTVAGTIAFFLTAVVACMAELWYFSCWDQLPLAPSWTYAAFVCVASSLVGALVETLPLGETDNVTTTLSSALVAIALWPTA